MPRFSLKSLVVVTAFIVLAVSHWQTSRRAAEMAVTLRALREEFNLIEVKDPKMAYVKRHRSDGDNTWKYSVYLPPDRRFALYQTSGPAKPGELPTRGSATEFKRSGHFTLTVKLESRHGRFVLRVLQQVEVGGSSTTYIDTPLQLGTGNNGPGPQVEWSPDGPIRVFSLMSPDGQGMDSGVAVFFKPMK